MTELNQSKFESKFRTESKVKIYSRAVYQDYFVFILEHCECGHSLVRDRGQVRCICDGPFGRHCSAHRKDGSPIHPKPMQEVPRRSNHPCADKAPVKLIPTPAEPHDGLLVSEYIPKKAKPTPTGDWFHRDWPAELSDESKKYGPKADIKFKNQPKIALVPKLTLKEKRALRIRQMEIRLADVA